MNLLLFLVLVGVVAGLPFQDDGCDINDCTGRTQNKQNKVPKNNEKNVNDTNEQTQHRIMELELQLAEQKDISENQTTIINDLKKILIDMNKTLHEKDEDLKRALNDMNKTSDEKDSELGKRIDELEMSLRSKNFLLEDKLQQEFENVSAQLHIVCHDCDDCEDVRSHGHLSSGVYGVNAGNGQTKLVYCEMTSDGGAWTRILHRQDNLTDFTYKNWAEYEAGFGDPQGSHWMGLITMYHLTNSRNYKLRVDLEDWEGETKYAEYSLFLVGPGSDKYRLRISGYNGTAGHSGMTTYHNNKMFTTIDSDNDQWLSGNCADGTGPRTGGWWYGNCLTARLTGTYPEDGSMPHGYGIVWQDWRGIFYSNKVATMKIQRR